MHNKLRQQNDATLQYTIMLISYLRKLQYTKLSGHM